MRNIHGRVRHGGYRRLLTALVAAAVWVMVPPGSGSALPILEAGDTITLDPVLSYGGGPFEVIPSSDPSDTFLTFCVERNEYFTPGDEYTISDISEYAVKGGIGGATDDKDPISPETAYLYYSFINGDFGNLTDDGYKGLQWAIWYFEGEGEPLSTASYYDEYQNFVSLAAGSGWNNIGAVRVINLISSSGGVAQSQLYLVPEPATVLLLGAGLIGVAVAARRRKKKRV